MGIDPTAYPLPTERRDEPAGYDTRLHAEVIALGDVGFSEAEMAAHLAVSLSTLNGWRAAHPEFAGAMERALTNAQAWWEGQIRLAILRGDTRFAVGAWQACMRARFPGYGERIEVAHTFDLTSRLVVVDLRTPEQVGADEPAVAIEAAAVVIDAGRGGA